MCLRKSCQKYNQCDHACIITRAEAGGSAFMPDTDVPKEEVDKGFLHAALNLGALYARFQHKSQAFAALKEAVMMAQEANDQACLQVKFQWLAIVSLQLSFSSPSSSAYA